MIDDAGFASLLEKPRLPPSVVKRAATALIPRAVILHVQICTCNTCGRRFEMPGFEPLVQFQNGRSQSYHNWQTAFPDTPRFVRTTEVDSEYCAYCFPANEPLRGNLLGDPGFPQPEKEDSQCDNSSDETTSPEGTTAPNPLMEEEHLRASSNSEFD